MTLLPFSRAARRTTPGACSSRPLLHARVRSPSPTVRPYRGLRPSSSPARERTPGSRCVGLPPEMDLGRSVPPLKKLAARGRTDIAFNMRPSFRRLDPRDGRAGKNA